MDGFDCPGPVMPVMRNGVQAVLDRAPKTVLQYRVIAIDFNDPDVAVPAIAYEVTDPGLKVTQIGSCGL